MIWIEKIFNPRVDQLEYRPASCKLLDQETGQGCLKSPTVGPLMSEPQVFRNLNQKSPKVKSSFTHKILWMTTL